MLNLGLQSTQIYASLGLPVQPSRFPSHLHAHQVSQPPPLHQPRRPHFTCPGTPFAKPPPPLHLHAHQVSQAAYQLRGLMLGAHGERCTLPIARARLLEAAAEDASRASAGDIPLLGILMDQSLHYVCVVLTALAAGCVQSMHA